MPSQLRHEFWTTFGRYMSPIPGTDGTTVNWINYRTGVRGITFRMQADKDDASICISISHPDDSERADLLEKLRSLVPMLEAHTNNNWQWPASADADSEVPSQVSICQRLDGVNVYRKEDWPSLIAFFKPTLIGLDAFWADVRDIFI